MTKKDYKLIADSLSASQADCMDFNINTEDVTDIFTHLTTNLALALQQQNPKFELAKFIDVVMR